MSKVFTIPFGQPFLETLADGIVNRLGQSPLLLGKSLIILPTRRGCLGLKEAFQKRRRAQLLPKIVALADLEYEPIVPGFIPPQLTSAMPSTQQLGLLTHLILKREKSSFATALNLASELSALMDEIHTSDVDAQHLHTLVGDKFAQHWQLTLDFLKIITEYWPTILHENGFIDGAQRRRDNLSILATQWSPDYPVILAGTTATRPATAELAQSIIEFPHGMVVLPGFPETSPTADSISIAKELPATHPLYTLNQFVDRLKPSQIIHWVDTQHPSAKTKLLNQLMVPVISSPVPLNQTEVEEIQASLTVVDCRDPDQEALVIALRIRQALADGLESVAVITPDLEITRRLQLHLKRWKIVANTSQGTPLNKTVVGGFLCLIAQFRHKQTPRGLLALLKHPLCYRHRDRGDHLIKVRQLDLRLRRLRQPDLESVEIAKETDRDWYGNFLKDLDIGSASKTSLTTHIHTLVQIAETLCLPDKLWKDSDGQAAHDFLTDLEPHAAAYPDLNLKEFQELLPQLMSQSLVHDRQGIGSPVQILGTLEARQTFAPLMILAGLNDGTWPQNPASDPWLNRQMRLDLGLPDPLRRIGLAAHDFCLGFSAPQVMITRNIKKDGTPTLPSRWWLRLETLLSIHNIAIDRGEDLKLWAARIDAPIDVQPAQEPVVCPDIKNRPTQFSTTDIEQLMRDPFGYYARRILKLKKLDLPDEPLTPRDLGNLIHESLEIYHRRHGSIIDLDKLITCGEQVFAPHIKDPHVRYFWWPRFVNIASWLIDQWHTRPKRQITTETQGAIDINYTDTLSAQIKSIADRIESDQDGAIILDYKTGSAVPSDTDIIAGLSPQLTIEALLLENGGFPNLNTNKVAALEYWHLRGGQNENKIKHLKETDDLVEQAYQGVKHLLQHFLLSTAPYLCAPWGESKPKNKDYLQLARLEEWN